jgi:hypothetical protein
MKNAYKNVLGRFVRSFISANTHSIIDAIAVYITCRNYYFGWDLTVYQITRRFSWEGVKPTVITFLVTDPYLREKFPWLKSVLRVFN